MTKRILAAVVSGLLLAAVASPAQAVISWEDRKAHTNVISWER